MEGDQSAIVEDYVGSEQEIERSVGLKAPVDENGPSQRHRCAYLHAYTGITLFSKVYGTNLVPEITFPPG